MGCRLGQTATAAEVKSALRSHPNRKAAERGTAQVLKHNVDLADFYNAVMALGGGEKVGCLGPVRTMEQATCGYRVCGIGGADPQLLRGMVQHSSLRPVMNGCVLVGVSARRQRCPTWCSASGNAAAAPYGEGQ